jgi:hypothetical protein
MQNLKSGSTAVAHCWNKEQGYVSVLYIRINGLAGAGVQCVHERK